MSKREGKPATGPERVEINRAPVLTLWAAVVAERLGYDRDTALTLAKAVTGLDAQAKGQRLGIYEPKEAEEKEKEKKERPGPAVELLGRAIPVVKTKEGVRATVKDKPVSPESVERYLRSKFGDALPEVRQSMEELARAYRPKELERRAYRLYTEFRPVIPAGVKGWGAKGELDLARIRALGEKGAR